jgi:hypothetical protein
MGNALWSCTKNWHQAGYRHVNRAAGTKKFQVALSYHFGLLKAACPPRWNHFTRNTGNKRLYSSWRHGWQSRNHDSSTSSGESSSNVWKWIIIVTNNLTEFWQRQWVCLWKHPGLNPIILLMKSCGFAVANRRYIAWVTWGLSFRL